jgi:hypothetical protein
MMNYHHDRTGTNLLTADEARQMIEHLFSSALKEMYNKGIEDCIEVCEKELVHLSKWNYKKDEPAKTSVLLIKQQLQQLRSGK